MTEIYKYSFDPGVSLQDVEESLVLSIVSVESLHGAALARLEVSHFLDRERRQCVIDGSSGAGRDLNKLFVGLLLKEFGATAFEVRRVEKSAQCEPSPHPSPEAA